MPFKFNPTTGKLDLVRGVNPLRVGAVQFDVNHTNLPSAPGLIQWNSVDGTYDMGLLNSSVLQVGQETMFYGKASGAIANGDLCQFAGVQGDHILIKKAVGSEIEAAPHYLVGVATENIANGSFGYVTWFGKINGVHTKTPANQDSADWLAGDILYFNITTGQLTKTMPAVPNRIITVAAVIKEQTGASESGIIIVRPIFGQKLQDLDDVNGTPLATSGQIPVWNQTNKYFDFTANINDYALSSSIITDHNGLNNLYWYDSAHYGNSENIAGFDYDGYPTQYSIYNFLQSYIYDPNGYNQDVFDYNSGYNQPDLSVYLNKDQTSPQTTFGRFTFPNLAVATNLLYSDSVNARLGIGTSTPTAKAHISGLGNGASGLLNVSSTSTNARGTLARIGFYSYWNMDTGGSTFWNWGARYDGEANQWVRAYTGANNYLPYLKYTVDGKISIGSAVSNLTTDANPTMTDKVTFNMNTGFLGIGTTSPTNLLTIAKLDNTNDATAKIISNGATDEILHFTNSTANNTWSIGRRNTANTFEIAYNANVNGNIRSGNIMSILNTGNVGVGTTTPVYRFELAGNLAIHRNRSWMGFDIYPVPAPTTLTGVANAGGLLGTGTYSYYVTYTTLIGETTAFRLDTTTTAGNNTITLTIPVSTDPRVTGRKLYRTKVGTIYYTEYLLATIANNTGTSYVDNIADASLTGSAGIAFARMNSTTYYITVGGSSAMILDGSVTAVGFLAGNLNISGYGNVLFGAGAGQRLTSGAVNCLYGGGAGTFLTTGQRNVVFGTSSGYNLTTESYNTIVGGYAMFYGAGASNVYVGHYAGLKASADIGTQTQNVFLGTNTANNDLQKINPTNEIVIGFAAYGTKDNQVTLGASTITETVLRGNVLIPTAVIGTSTDNTTFEADGTQVMNGTATVYDDIQFNISSGKVPAANNPAWSAWNGLSEYSFTVDDYIDLGAQEFLHSWKEGTAVELHVHWSTGTGNYVNGDKVNWQIEYTWANMASTQPFTAFPAPTAVSAEQAFTTTVAPYSHVYTSIVSFTPTGGKIGAQLKVRLKRIAKSAGGTDPGTNPFALQVGMHYQIDTIGSRTVSGK